MRLLDQEMVNELARDLAIVDLEESLLVEENEQSEKLSLADAEEDVDLEDNFN